MNNDTTRSPDSQPAPEQPEEWQPLGPYAQVRVQPSPALSDKQEAERELFEAWSKRIAPAYGFDKDERGHYVAYPVHAGWAAWQERARLAAPQAKSAPSSDVFNAAGWLLRILDALPGPKINRAHLTSAIENLRTLLVAQERAALARRATAGNAAPTDVVGAHELKSSAVDSQNSAELSDNESSDLAGSAAAPGDMEAARDAVYPIPDSPHTSVIQRASDDRIAFRFGWEACIASTARAAPLGAEPEVTLMVGRRVGRTHALAQQIIDAMPDDAKARTSYGNIRDVLDAFVRMNRAPSPASQAASQLGAQEGNENG